jgi:thioredoxin reductase
MQMYLAINFLVTDSLNHRSTGQATYYLLLMYDLIIIGAGPAGMAASARAVQENLKTLVITKEVFQYDEKNNLDFFDIENIISNFNAYVKAGKLDLLNKTEVINLEKNVVSFSAEVKSGKIYYGKTAIIASGFNTEQNMANTDFEKNARKDFLGRIVVNNSQDALVKGLFAAGGASLAISSDKFWAISDGIRAIYGVKEFLK